MIQQYVRYQEQEDLGQAKLEMKWYHGRKPVEIHL
jgi:hypothetical protein